MCFRKFSDDFHVFARSVSHTITTLEVPLWADPRREAELRCQYMRQQHDPPLHSVKWYRDLDEIFRYTPQVSINTGDKKQKP
ncbi:hypothetical protein PYW08_016824 [Mythimna loreyi]|uniref:Uncharacterized protein n=1 Tax=Mythimna loreyi TaxID=667449 RepID=A0ACC2QYQ5_9NEOP|nr:hypothetical protein PYW08_016824 [Mythimna loreyi]